MIPTPIQEPYLLSKERNQQIFEQRIRNTILPFSSPSSEPHAIFLGGQSGSGKSSLTKYILSSGAFGNERAIIINSDSLREFHPDFVKLQKSDSPRASFLVNPDATIWQQKLITVAINTARNLLLDGTLGGSAEPVLATMNLLREAGYNLHVSILAVPARLSRFGIYERFERQTAQKGSGRWVGLETHDRQYDEIPKTLALLEDKKIVDQIQIYARPVGLSSLQYDNQLKDGQWVQTPNALHALTNARDRVWTSEEQAAFAGSVRKVAEQMRQRGVSQNDIDNFHRYVECPL